MVKVVTEVGANQGVLMTSLFVVRIAGAFALLAVAAQFAAFGIAFASGIQPGAPLDFSDGAQLLAAGNVSAGVLGLVLATISPSLGLPLGLALYVVLKKEAQGYALFGATMVTVGMTIALVHEVLRIVVFWRMPDSISKRQKRRGLLCSHWVIWSYMSRTCSP